MNGLPIISQQNIPLTVTEAGYINREIKRFKKQAALLWVLIMLTIVLIFLFTGFANGAINFGLGVAAVTSVAVIFLLAGRQIKLLQKDRHYGKTKLQTIIADKNSSDEPVHDTVAFYKDENRLIIILKVTRQQFLQFKAGDKVEVTYLPNCKEVLQMVLVR